MSPFSEGLLRDNGIRVNAMFDGFHNRIIVEVETTDGMAQPAVMLDGTIMAVTE